MIILGVLSAILVGLAIGYHRVPVGPNDIGCMLGAFGNVGAFFSLSIGIAVMLIAMAVEWSEIYNHVRVNRMPLASVESDHPRLPPKTEVMIASILTVAALILFVQFIATVYAMAFTLSSSTIESKVTARVVMGDYDGDGDLDYIAGNTGASEQLDFYKNDGTGTFTWNSMFGLSTNMVDMVTGDINGDGYLDIIELISLGSSSVGVYLNSGTGSFRSVSAPTLMAGGTIMTLFDADNDADLDLLFLKGSTMINPLFLNDGHGVFTEVASNLPLSQSAIGVADFDTDGYLDLVFSSTAATAGQVFRNSGTGSFVQLSSFANPPANLAYFAPADIDNDGDIDLIAAGNGNAYTFFNSGAGTFTLGSNYGTIVVTNSISTGDIDNDGDIDFILSGCDIGLSGGAEIFLNNGSGVYSTLGAVTEGADCVKRSIIGDIDGDGDLDYIRGNQDYFGTNRVNRHYKSDQAATTANTVPTAPTLSTLTGTLVSPTPRNPRAAANDLGIGTIAWSNATNVYASDDAYATASFTAPSGISNYLTATDFGFTIPTGATILGIKAEVEKKQGVGVIDYAVRLIKGGAVGTTDRSAAGSWLIADTTSTYGSGSDLWGTTWTPAQINASDFGFAMVAQDAGAGGATAFVDHIRITVYYNMRDIRLTWGSGSDTITSTKMLQYQLKIGTGSALNNIYSSLTSTPNWVTRVVPNGQSRTTLLRNLPCGQSFYWSVAAVDSGFMSTRSSEQTFTLSAACGFSGGAGGGGGSSSSGTAGPAGGSLRRIVIEQAPPRVIIGHIAVSAFEDINGNGVKDLREENTFQGLTLTASGSTASGVTVRKTLNLSSMGEAVFELEQSDARGYSMLVDPSSKELEGFEATGKIVSDPVIVREGTMQSVAFAFRRVTLLDYKPCLTVASAASQDRGKGDALILLGRLEDAFSRRITDGVTLGAGLVTRANFLTLLARTQCIPLEQTPVAYSRKGRKNILIDLPPTPPTTFAILVYSLLGQELPVARLTPKGPAADLSAPLTRREALSMLAAAMNIPEDKRVSTATDLPSDLLPQDPILSDFLTLRSLGILPQNFLSLLGAEQGMDATETASLLTRASFQAGHIGLLPIVFDRSGHAAAPEEVETLHLPEDFPDLPVRECLLTDTERPKKVSFSDILPGDVLEPVLRDILSRGTKNGDDKTLWLLPANKKPTEFGVTKGTPTIDLDQPVSLFEGLRTLLVLRCLPPLSAKEFVLSSERTPEGSLESRVPRDRLSGLQRDLSFVSRVFYRAQDHEREFDLSLLKFSPDLLTGETRDPDSPLSVGDGSALLASGLLNLAVHESLITPQDAEIMAEGLTLHFARYFLGTPDLERGSSSMLRTLPLTRKMLIEFLGAVLEKETVPVDAPKKASKENRSVGESWWERLQ